MWKLSLIYNLLSSSLRWCKAYFHFSQHQRHCQMDVSVHCVLCMCATDTKQPMWLIAGIPTLAYRQHWYYQHLQQSSLLTMIFRISFFQFGKFELNKMQIIWFRFRLPFSLFVPCFFLLLRVFFFCNLSGLKIRQWNKRRWLSIWRLRCADESCIKLLFELDTRNRQTKWNVINSIIYYWIIRDELSALVYAYAILR